MFLGYSLRTDDGTDIGSFNDAFDGSKDDKLDGSTLGVSLVSTDGYALGIDEVVNVGSPDD